MARLVSTCPSCSGPLRVSRLSCPGCGVQLDGEFETPPLLRLSPEDQAFVTAFVKVSGSLKAMAQLDGTSYPTVRNRLNEVIARLAAEEAQAARRRQEILDALESGKISASRAERELRKVGL